MRYETIRLEIADGVAVVRLHRPERMNAVTELMYRELLEAFDRLEADDGVRAALLTGSVRRKDGVEKQAFCAGADLKQHGEGKRTRADQRAYLELAHEAARRLYRIPIPVVAAVNGPARGAGAELALCCDLILIAEPATLAFSETSLGTFVGGGSTRHLPALVGITRAKELIYTGRAIDGREAVEIGLALSCWPEDELERRAGELARELAAKAPLSMRLAKRRLQQPAALDLETVLALETQAVLSCMETDDWHEGVRAFAERREPVFEGR
ncbi:MAG: enoyl-CoA hydratase/isomerase family protein [Polyangia bacterium]